MLKFLTKFETYLFFSRQNKRLFYRHIACFYLICLGVIFIGKLIVMKRNAASLLLLIFLQLNILSTEARDFYWIGGSGNFNDIQHWSDQPGGKVNPDALLPDKDDNVYFDQFSFPFPGAEVVITNVARCLNMYWGDVKNMPTLKADDNLAHYLVIYGGVKFTNKMILDLDRPLYFRANTLGNEIDFGGITFNGDFVFENNGGWRITSSLNLLDNDIYFNQGTLSIEADVTCGRIISENAVSRELYLNSSIITLQESGASVLYFQTENLDLLPGHSKIVVNSGNSSIETFGSKSIAFYNVEFSENSGAIETNGNIATFNEVAFLKGGSLKGQNDFQKLIFTEGNSYFIYSGGLQNVLGRFEAVGTCSAYISISSESSGGNISAAEVDLNYLKVKNIAADGTAANFSAPNSFDLGGNIKWNFVTPIAEDYTWTGAINDNWGNPGNWDKGCVPSRINNVFINGTSTVFVDVASECKNLYISDNSNFSGTENLEIFGSLDAGNASWAFSGETNFKGDLFTNTISINAAFQGPVIFEGAGEWKLSNDLAVDNRLELNEGTLNANGKVIQAGQFVSNGILNRTLNISNSNFTITEGVSKAWNVGGSNFSFLGANSAITMTQIGAEFYNKSSDGIQYGRVLFYQPDGQVFLTNEGSADPEFTELEFRGSAKIVGNHQFEKLTLSKGKEYLFQAGSTQKIIALDGLVAHGTCSENISLTGEGGIAYFNCDVSSSDLFRLRIENVNVVGGIGNLVANESIGVVGYDGWIFPNDLVGGDVYWTGASDDDWFKAGNWSTGCIPTRKDNVIFNETNVTTGSKAIRISKKGSIAECKNMTWTNAALLSFNGDQPISVFGSLDLSGMQASNFAYSGNFNFKAESPENIKLGTVALIGDVNLIGTELIDGSWSAGSWTLQSDLKTDGTIVLKNGDLISDSKNIEAKEFISNFGLDYPRSLDLGASILSLEKFEVSPDAFTFEAGTSEIKFSKGGDFIVSKGANPIDFYNLSFQATDGNAYVDIYADDITFNNMVFNNNTYFRKTNVSKIAFSAKNIQMAVGKTYVFESGQTYEFGNVVANGACEGTIDITGSRSEAAIFRAETGITNITVNSVNILNVTAEPANVFVAKSSISLGNTEGWKFEDEPAGSDLFWIGGTGNWDDPNHWSTKSGYKVGGCVPTAKDNVFFDDGSFDAPGQTVYTGASDIRCRTMDWTGSEGARPHFEMGNTDISGVYIYGSLILNSELKVDLSPLVNFYFRATEAQVINSFGYVFPNIVEFDGKGGEWTLLDNVVIEGDCFIRYGKLITAGKDLECKSLSSTEQTEGVNTRGLDIRNSKITITGKEDIIGRSIYLNLADIYNDQAFEFLSDNSTITFSENANVVIIGTAAHSISFDQIVFEKGGELDSGFSGLDSYVSHLYFKGNGSINGKKNNFGTLELGRGFEYKFEKNRSYQMDYLVADGSCFAPIYIHSNVAGTKTTILAANNVVGNFLELKDIAADNSKGATYIATNSFDLGNVTGWVTDGVIAPIALYWTGKGTDDSWHNHENWSRSADGSEEGCVPTLNDDVFFTNQSFLGSKRVEITADASCHNMTWMDDVDPGAYFMVNSKLQFGGFMDLTESMTMNMNGALEFVGDGQAGDKMVDFAGKSMNGDIIFDGDNQSWFWNSEMSTSGVLYIEAGSVSTKGFDFAVGRFSSLSLANFYAVRKFDMSGSLVTVTSDLTTGWNMIVNTDIPMEFTATNSQITFPNGGGIFCRTDSKVSFNWVDFYNNGIININGGIGAEGSFGSVAFHEQGKVFGNNTFSNLEFTLGYENNTIEAGKTITIINDLIMEGVRCSWVFLKSSKNGVKAYINKPVGLFSRIFNASFTDIEGISASTQPVYYQYDKNNSVGFELVDDNDTANPPSFEETPEARAEFCSTTAVLDHVKHFPINNSTTFQWYFSLTGVDGTFSPLNGETNTLIEVSESGFYKVDVYYGIGNDGNDCMIGSVIEVLLGTVSTVSLEITANNVKCHGEGNGRIVAKVKEGVDGNYPDYTFFWKDEKGNDVLDSSNSLDWTSTAQDLSPGKYYISVEDSKGCDFDTVVNIFDAYKLVIDDITTKDLACYTNPQGEILVSASGGTGNLSYYLDDELQANENITGLHSGSYNVYVEDGNSCITDEELVLINSNPEMVLNLNATNLLCFDDKNGTFSPEVAGGVPNYTYSWTGPAGFTSTNVNLTDLAGGFYHLTVTDAVNCKSEVDHELLKPEQLTTNELIVEPTNCHGESTGEIFVEAKQGTPVYRYFLDNVESTTGIFSNLSPKQYPLKIVDANGCEFETNVEVTEPSEIGFIVTDKVLPSCEKTNDGIILITPYGGNGAYDFSWSGPEDYRAYTQNISGLVSGEYSLLIKDKKNCTSENIVDLDLGLPLQLGLVVEQNVSASGAKDGILAIEVIEGTTPYTFTVTGPGFTRNSPDNFDDHYYLIENLAGGVYSVVATDASGCNTVEKSIIIEEPGQVFAFIEMIHPVGCPGNSDGELRVQAKGGNGSYTYNWSSTTGYSGIDKTATDLAPGTYTVTVTSGVQSATATFELLPADPLLVSVSNYKDASCNNAANGEIELAVDAGNVDYTISWTDGTGFLSSAKRISNLEPGTYNYSVTTQYGCIANGSQSIIEPSKLASFVTSVDISKAGERDGELSATISGGTGPYTILVSGPNGYSYRSTNNATGTIFIDKLEMGVYEVVGIDANDCRIEETKKVHEPDKLLIYVVKKTDVICPNGNNGAIEIEVEGFSAIENLTYSWTGDNYFRSTDKNISGLKAGNYKVTVFDSAGDPGYEEQSIIVPVIEPDTLAVEFWKKDISCFGLTDGYINIYPKGGTPGYTYSWTGNVVNKSEEDQNGLSKGTYSVMITDANGCPSKTISVEILEPEDIFVKNSLLEPSCYGLENGWIKLDITSGTQPYFVDWSNYGSVNQNISELEKGVYDYIVTDDHGCSKTGSVTLNEPDTLIAEINNSQDVLCHGDGSGWALVDIQGGTPEYAIEWSDGQSTEEATDLKLGHYQVKVTDKHGCTDTASIDLFEPEPLKMKVEVIRPTTIDSKDGAIALDITGGVLDYTIDWNLDFLSGDSYIKDLGRGDYIVHILDANSCPLDSTIVLEYLFENRIKIPKAFTPNNDGYNDYWDLERIEFVQDLKIVIYDRWGKTVYKFSGTGNEYKGTPWTGADGTTRLPIGSYYYAVELDGEKPLMGTVTILR